LAFHGKRFIGVLAVAGLDASSCPSGSCGGHRGRVSLVRAATPRPRRRFSADCGRRARCHSEQPSALCRNSSKHTKGVASAIPVRHLLPYLSRLNRHRCVHARPARPQALAVARLRANHVASAPPKMKGPARGRGLGARLSGRRLAGRLLHPRGRGRGEPAGKKARYPDALPGIPLLLPLGRRPAQARPKSSTLRAGVNAPIGVVFDPNQAGRCIILRMSEIVFVVEQAPEGGFTARAVGESIFTEADDLTQPHARATRCAAISTRARRRS
jgi:hypothetical protein